MSWRTSSWSAEAARLKLASDRVTEASQALLLGEKAGADMAFTGFYWMEKDRVLVSLQCYDVKAGTLITGFLHTWRFNLGFYNAIHAEIADLVQRVVFLSAPKLITLKNDVRVDEITFTSPQNGMEVLIEGHKSVGRIQNGTLVFQTDGMKAGTPFMVEKRQDGYHTLRQTVIASPEVALTGLPRANNLSVEIDWTGGQLEGAGADASLVPEARLDHGQFLRVPVHADSVRAQTQAGPSMRTRSSWRVFTSSVLPRRVQVRDIGRRWAPSLPGFPQLPCQFYRRIHQRPQRLVGVALVGASDVCTDRSEVSRRESATTSWEQVGPPLHWGQYSSPHYAGSRDPMEMRPARIARIAAGRSCARCCTVPGLVRRPHLCFRVRLSRNHRAGKSAGGPLRPDPLE